MADFPNITNPFGGASQCCWFSGQGRFWTTATAHDLFALMPNESADHYPLPGGDGRGEGESDKPIVALAVFSEIVACV